MSEGVKLGDKVSIHYVGKLEDGTVFDSSEGRDAFEFEAGSQNVIPGMSQGVLGMRVGDEKTVHIPQDQAYGPHHEQLVVQVANGEMPDGVSEGDVLSDGQPGSRNWVVVERGPEITTLDGNHPLAGKTLIFDVTLVAIA